MALRSIDLMIGDWVKSRGEIEQVTSVYDGFICTDSFEDSHDYYFDPIPLTDEILEKNGFGKEIIDHTTYFVLKDVAIFNDCEFGYGFGRFYKDSEDGRVFVEIATFFNVHQLQHALRLCGIEKEITI